MTRFAHSRDEEIFHGDFTTAEEAWDEYWSEHDDRNVGWVGECVPPRSPALRFDIVDLFESVSCQDEYSGDWADHWDHSTKEQRAEINAEVRGVIQAWLDRHALNPTFFMVEKVERWTRPEEPDREITDAAIDSSAAAACEFDDDKPTD